MDDLKLGAAATWVTALTGIVAVCYAIDKVLHRRAKQRIQNRLCDWWIKLEDTPVPEVHQIVADRTLRFIKRLLGGTWTSDRALLTGVAISLLLTLLAVVGGVKIADWLFDFIRGSGNRPKEVSSATMEWLRTFSTLKYISQRPLWFAQLCGVNFLFDGICIVVTILFLRQIRGASVFQAAVFVLMDAAVAVLCSLGSAIFAIWYSFQELMPIGAPGTDKFDVVFKWAPRLTVALPFALTTLVPIACYLTAVFFMLVGKPVLAALRRLGLHALERIADDEPAKCTPFTVCGLVLSIGIGISKIFAMVVWQR